MHVAALLPALILALAAAPATTPAVAGKVCSYNIEALHRGLEGVVATLMGLQCDVLALQEVDRKTKRSGDVDQPAALADALGMKAVFAAAMPFDGGEYGLAVLSREPVELVAVHRLRRQAQEEPRIAMQVTTRVAGQQITVVNTHLAANWRTKDPDALRALQASDVVRLSKHITGPLVVIGDFNFTPGSPPYTRLAGELRVVSSGAATHPAEAPERAIDHAFARLPASIAVKGSSAVHSLASDHLPLVLNLVVTPPHGAAR